LPQCAELLDTTIPRKHFSCHSIWRISGQQDANCLDRKKITCVSAGY
jgi:hypothetical protein